MVPQTAEPVEVFISYSHRDDDLRAELQTHLVMLRRNGVVRDWSDRRINPGQEWDKHIDEHLESADILLLLVSPDFLASDYCYDIEVTRAMERHEAGEARVIPVILRHCDDWQSAPFGKLQALPKDARPVKDWPDRDKAFADVAAGIRHVVAEMLSSREGQPETFTEESARATRQSLIPRRPTVGFVPRRYPNGDSIVARLQEELAPHRSQLVALWGAGGVGKTTLTAEAARGLEAAGQRVVWVSADGRANFTLSTLLDDIAAQFGRTDLRPLGLEPKQEAVRALIAEAPTLIVLDNFETIPPDEQPLCVNFLAERARCPALITTRESIDEARPVLLRPMLAEEGRALLDRLVEQTINPGIYTEAIRERILETAEHNPLVIQWVVRQINLANDPEEVLDDLKHGEGDAAERVFDRSYNLPQLGDGGRAVLLALSLFMPSATRSALAEVAGLGKDKDRKKFKKAQETLASLWLLPPSGGQRLALEGLTREFAKARLSHDPRSKPFRQRFVNRFLRYAEANSKTTAEQLNLIEAEKDNILSAIDVALELGDAQSAMSAYHYVYNFLDLRGYWNEAIRRGKQSLYVARNLADMGWIAVFTHNVAILLQNQGEIEEARHLYGESLDIKKRIGDQRGIAASLHNLAILAHQQGEMGEARRLYAESLDIRKRLGDQSGIADSLHQLAMLAHDEGESDEARRLYAESLDIKKRLGDQKGVAANLHESGRFAHEQGEMEEARRLYAESLDIAKKLGDQRGVAASLHHLAMLAHDEGESDEARRLYNESLDIKKKLGDQSGVAASLHQLGLISLDEGGLSQAERLFNESLTVLRKLGHKQNIAECLESMGRLKIREGSLSEARGLFDEALRMAEGLSDKFRVASVKHSAGLLAEKEGDGEGAARLLREALVIFEELNSPKKDVVRQDLSRVEGQSS
ncbi:MAG TPA: tetratricopeptide repeat protein [Pyrinomonadaceae bacterium]|nr:tetratricopeptide repeat protein [Pyrinomonadaceae bacterium]